jgi:hypothetical protein
MHQYGSLPLHTFRIVIVISIINTNLLLRLEHIGDPSHTSIEVTEDICIGCIVDRNGKRKNSRWRR